MIDYEPSIETLKLLYMGENSILLFEIFDSLVFVSPLSAKQFMYVAFHQSIAERALLGAALRAAHPK